MNKIGIIGSTGIKIDLLTDKYEFESIPVGEKSFKFYHGYRDNCEVILTARNQYAGSVPPHKVDYKLIMDGMKALGVDIIIGTSVAGSLKYEIEPGTYVVVDQFLDFTKRTPFTAFDGDKFAFVDFAEPYCPTVRAGLIEACKKAGVTYRTTGTYVGVDGPRYETSAEVKMFGMLGGDVVGMTNVTETIMARETGQCYATVSIVVNYGAGMGQKKEIYRTDCYEKTMEVLDHTVDILKQFLDDYTGEKHCNCASKIDDMLG